MSTPAYVNTGSIYFELAENAKDALHPINQWVEQAMSGTLPDKDINGDYGIYNVEHDGHCWISFKAESGRVQNLEWQMENFRDFVKTLDKAVAFEAPIMMESDNGIFWELEEDRELIVITGPVEN